MGSKVKVTYAEEYQNGKLSAKTMTFLYRHVYLNIVSIDILIISLYRCRSWVQRSRSHTLKNT